MTDSYCTECCDLIPDCECGKTKAHCPISIVCPYCGHEMDPYDTEGRAFMKTTGIWACDKCEKLFNLEVRVQYSWTTTRREDRSRKATLAGTK